MCSRHLMVLPLLVATAAFAVNPESTLLSQESALAGAVLAADDDSGGGWYNPASLGGLKRNSLRLGISAYSAAFVDANQVLITHTPWSTQVQDTHAFRYSSVPSVLGLTWRLREGLGLSLGLWTPYHDVFSAGIDTTDSGPLPTNPAVTATLSQRYDWAESADDTWASAALGWQLHRSLRVGVALQAAYSTADRAIRLETRVGTDSTDPAETGAHLHVNVRQKTDTIALRGVLGLQWRPKPFLGFGLAVRTPRLQVFRRIDRVQVFFAGALLPPFAPQEGGFIDTVPMPSRVAVIDPARVLAGAQLDLGRWSVRLDGEWSPAMEIPGETLGAVLAIPPQTVLPSVRARLGTLFAWNPNLTLGLGATFDSAHSIAAEGQLAVDTWGITGGVTSRSEDVLRALGGGDSWDLLNTIAVAGSFGFGRAPGISVVPLALGESVLPLLPGQETTPFLEVPARLIDLSVHFMSTLKF